MNFFLGNVIRTLLLAFLLLIVARGVQAQDVPPNQPPVLSVEYLTVNATEGGGVSNTIFASDPDNDPVLVDFGFGFSSGNGDGTWDYFFVAAEGPVSFIVPVIATDGHNPPVQTTFTVVIANEPPTGDLQAFTPSNDPVTAGGSYEMYFSNVFDAGKADRFGPFFYSFDCTNDGTFEVVDSTTSFHCIYPVSGTFTVKGRLKDKDGGFNEYLTQVTIYPANQPPVCTNASPSAVSLWPPNHNLIPISVTGVSDPDNDPVVITITSIFQDEPTNGTGDGDTSPDGLGLGTNTAQLRAERGGRGNGRVYHIGFSANDGRGGVCQGEIRVGVPQNQGNGKSPTDDGALYDSTAQ
jgi:hypothetical protein